MTQKGGAQRRALIARLIARLAAVAMAAAAASPAMAQADAAAGYPKQPIRFIIGFAPGGGNDLIGRIVGQKLSERIGQPVVVENKSGAAGAIAAEYVARAAPDGYTLLIAPVGTLVFNPAIYAKLPYDPQKSFVPITMVGDYPLYLCVRPDMGFKTVKDLVAFSKANPDKANYASTSGVFQLTAELFKEKTSSPFEQVPFKSSAEMITAVVTGQTTMAFIDPSALMPFVKSGKIQLLATTGPARRPDLPDIPTMAEAGVNDVIVNGFTALVAPAGTPMPIVRKLETEVNAVIKEPFVLERFKQLVVDAVGGTSESVSQLMEREIPKWKAVAKAANIKGD